MANCIWFVVALSLATFCTFTFGQGTADPPSQDDRVFEDVCRGCRVSKGFGFASDLTDCNCYYLCVNRKSLKLASYESPWVSYLRCCPCDQSFSWKLLTCVDCTDKRSDCFSRGPHKRDANVCNDTSDGVLFPRTNPNHAGSGEAHYLCSGYYECKTVGNKVVPSAKCCPDGQCFDSVYQECNIYACDAGYCDTLRDKDDCECDQTTAPESECAFMEYGDDVSKFMGVENMKIYDCAPGTCWNQASCTCVRTNNTGYDDCDPFAELDFSVSESALDGRGNTIWTQIIGDVNITNDEATFDGGYINIGGLANTYFSNLFIMHITFVLKGEFQPTTTAVPLDDYRECLISNCINSNPNNRQGPFSVIIERDGFSQEGINIQIRILYKTSAFWIPGTSTEPVTLNLDARYELDTEYKLLLVYHGPEEEAFAGVFDVNDDNQIISSDIEDVDNSKTIVSSKSGIMVGGPCGSARSLEAVVKSMRMYRLCKPFENSDFEDDFDALYANTH